MCGIIAYLSESHPIEQNHIQAAIDVLKHRGPDEQGIYTTHNNHLALGHTRLSIIGPDNGKQPIISNDGAIVVVVNGEFYDYINIRNKLIDKGYAFTTQSDSEILIYLYLEYGVDCLKYLNGEFSFVLWDKRDNSIFAARDRFGIKPLYYTKYHNAYYIASEVKALREMGVSLSINENSLLDFSYGLPNASQSLFNHIDLLPPGHFLLIKQYNLQLKQYYQFIPQATAKLSKNEAKEQFKHLFQQAVQRRLVSDVPVACYLSGGIDSAATAAMAAQQKDITTFTIGFDDEAYDESKYATRVAEYLGLKHYRIAVSSDDIIKSYAQAIYHRESLVYQTSGVAKFLLSQYANQFGYKVVLTGEGADELLLGYPSFAEDYLKSYVNSNKQSAIKSKISASQEETGSAYVSAINLQQKGYPSFMALSYEIGQISQAILSSPLLSLANKYSPFDTFAEKNIIDSECPVARAQYAWSQSYFPELILSYLGDRMEMAHSIEGRLPFLDMDLVNFVNQLPIEYKIDHSDDIVDKAILRQAMTNLLPKDIIMRPKHFYASPAIFKQDQADPMIKFMQEIFSDTQFQQMGLYDGKKIMALIQKAQTYGKRQQMIVEFGLNVALSSYFLCKHYC